ncbi:helix-turn-helix domain-containing protein [Parasediminibacterium sp. JCM 36343]|uniref:helix-turn-helix domain-containing protein n=1 Tax=Parasediminibacterium sp. JCM 36343 TaxID=3374279 RepID=UPI00397C7CC8
MKVDKDNSLQNIGTRIKQMRISQKRVLQEVADLCGLSKSMLSKIENDKALPSVASLVKIATVLGTTISSLMEENTGLDAIYTPKQKSLSGLARTGKGYAIFPFASGFHHKKMQPFLFTAKKGEVKPHLLSHEGEEFVFVLKGEMKMDIGNTSYHLKEGDSLYFNATQMHGIMPISDEVEYIDIFV